MRETEEIRVKTTILKDNEILTLLVFKETSISSYNSEIISVTRSKQNITNRDGDLWLPKQIEILKSGKTRMWISPQKGKSFSQYSFVEEIEILK